MTALKTILFFLLVPAGVADVLCVKHCSYRTEQTYVDWIRRYILFHNKRHPQDMGATEVRAFLADLAVNRRVSTSA